MTYDQWFKSQQGIAYEGQYLFAEAAWVHQLTRIINQQGTIKQLQKDLAEREAELVAIKKKVNDSFCGCVGIHRHQFGICQTCNQPVIGWWEVAESAIEDLVEREAECLKLRETLSKIESLEADNGCILSAGECAMFATEALSTPPSTSYLEQWERERYGEPIGTVGIRGDTMWFKQNPHAYPIGTVFYVRKD